MRPGSRKLRKAKSGINHTGKKLGNHNPIGSEVFHIDFLGKGIRGDENNVCLWKTTTIHHFLPLELML